MSVFEILAAAMRPRFNAFLRAGRAETAAWQELTSRGRAAAINGTPLRPIVLNEPGHIKGVQLRSDAAKIL